jgi:hypothetical protein
LFEGLAMEKLETEWKKYPVLYFDLLECEKATNATEIYATLNEQLSAYENIYGVDEIDGTPGRRFANILSHAFKMTGKKCVVIIDNYDSPWINVIDNVQEYTYRKRIMMEFYIVVKALEEYEHFVFITGITKFSTESTFSGLNNLTDISSLPQYSTICGTTVDKTFSKDEKNITEWIVE